MCKPAGQQSRLREQIGQAVHDVMKGRFPGPEHQTTRPIHARGWQVAVPAGGNADVLTWVSDPGTYGILNLIGTDQDGLAVPWDTVTMSVFLKGMPVPGLNLIPGQIATMMFPRPTVIWLPVGPCEVIVRMYTTWLAADGIFSASLDGFHYEGGGGGEVV